MITEKEKQNFEKLLRLKQENPNLPIIPMVDCEIVMGDEYCRWMGAWGSSSIEQYLMGKERVYFREDNDECEVETLVSEVFGYDAYENMSDAEANRAYAEMPWKKAIIVNIDIPNE